MGRKGLPRTRSNNLRDLQRRECPPAEWVAALKEAAFRADASDDGYRVPSNPVIAALLAEGLSEWLPTTEAVEKWYRQQNWGGWVYKLRFLRATGVYSWAGERRTRKVRHEGCTRPSYS